MSSENDQNLIGQLLDGDISDNDREQLLAALRNNPAALETLADHLRISEALSRLQPERSEDRFVHSTIDHALVRGGENDNAFVSKVAHRIENRQISKRLAIAAAIVLGGIVSTKIYQEKGAANSAPFATMVELDEQGSLISEHPIGAKFKHVARHGLVRLNFNNGATVAIEAPADFSVVSEKEMQLTVGKLNAWCPERAHGFKVVTATGTVTDLGTSFAVSTSKNGASDFLVLDGLIEVSQGRNTRRLDQGTAVRTDHSPGFKELEFEAGTFVKTWPLASGILSTRGSVSPAPPGTAEQLSQLEDDHSVLVIPEKRTIALTRDIEAEMTSPGSLSTANAKEIHVISAAPERRLRSYLVRYNPKYDPTTRAGFRRFEGEVTFDRPVLAICCQGRYLDATDSLFAIGDWSKPDTTERKFRGVDLDQPKEYPDEVRLSEDRRTVQVIFNAGISTDDIRVIVEE